MSTLGDGFPQISGQWYAVERGHILIKKDCSVARIYAW
jgi:hypothetical protein